MVVNGLLVILGVISNPCFVDYYLHVLHYYHNCQMSSLRLMNDRQSRNKELIFNRYLILLVHFWCAVFGKLLLNRDTTELFIALFDVSHGSQ